MSLTDDQRLYLEVMRAKGGVKAIWRFEEECCRRCSTNQGLSADARCHAGTVEPIENECPAFIEVINERIGGHQ